MVYRGNAWVVNTPMTETRAYGTAECWDGYVWAIGGTKAIDDVGRTVAMERFSIRDGKWKSGLLAGEAIHISP